MPVTYKDEKNARIRSKNMEMLETLPDFCRSYLIALERSISPVTLHVYLQRISIFLKYLHSNNSFFSSKEVKQFTITDMEYLSSEDINEFAHWIYNTNNSDKRKTNKEKTVDNYLSALSSLWNYFLIERYVESNPVALVKHSKHKDKEIIKLDKHEQDAFLNSLYNGEGFNNKKQLEWNERTKIRDIAICKTLLGTGLRVSELVGLDVDDIDFQENCFKVIRKRDKIDIVYFSDEVRDCLLEYLEERIPRYQPVDNERALFLVGIGTCKGQRISERSIEKIVKKFAKAGVPTKGAAITPHKLRATYATDLLEATGDLDLVRENLAHSDPKTTMIYAKTSLSKKKEYRNVLMQ